MVSCTLKEKYIRFISSKEKTKEARMGNPMFQKWQVGDEIKFFSKRNPKMYVIIKITRKAHYKNVQEMLEKEGIESIVPNVSDIRTGVKLYYALPNYRELERKYGVLLFEFDLIKPHDSNSDWNLKRKSGK